MLNWIKRQIIADEATPQAGAPTDPALEAARRQDRQGDGGLPAGQARSSADGGGLLTGILGFALGTAAASSLGGGPDAPSAPERGIGEAESGMDSGFGEE